MPKFTDCGCICHTYGNHHCQPPCCSQPGVLYSEMEGYQQALADGILGGKAKQIVKSISSRITDAKQAILQKGKEYSDHSFKVWNEHRSRSI